MNEDWINMVIEDFKETVIFETEYEEGMRCHYQDAVNWLRKILERNQELLHQELQKARAEAWREAVDLADKIELREPDGGTKQWMAFKAFRNTLRDKIKDHSELDQEVNK